MLAEVDTLRLEEALIHLRAARVPHVRDAIAGLQRLRALIGAAEVLHEYHPAQYEHELAGVSVPDLLVDGDVTQLELTTYDILTDLFPADTDWMQEQLAEGEPGPEIMVVPQGIQYSLDDLDDLLTLDRENITPNRSLALFLVMLCDSMFIEPEHWETAIETYGWPIEIPHIPRVISARFDWEHFEVTLDNQDLAPFARTMEMASRETGNIFLDWNPYEGQEIADDMSLNLANVKILVDQWNDAQEYIASFEKAAQMVDENPGLIATLLEIFSECMEYGNHSSREPKTLAEIWAEEANGFDADEDILTDEFYGPIGVEVDDVEVDDAD